MSGPSITTILPAGQAVLVFYAVKWVLTSGLLVKQQIILILSYRMMGAFCESNAFSLICGTRGMFHRGW